MANSFFRFKQFTVHQNHCAMKVCTDACLFGAWLSVGVRQSVVNRILDIGTGTGLLSLMLAQKIPDAIIDAVEIDEAAAQQAKENFDASPWKERLFIHNTSIQKFNLSTKYDLIISNPPFFENDLQAEDKKRNIALHSTQLTLDELILIIKNKLLPTGTFAVLLPYNRSAYFEEKGRQNGFYLDEKLLVKQTPKHDYFRSMLYFTQQQTATTKSEIIIKTDEGNYSEEFTELLKHYYLNL